MLGAGEPREVRGTNVSDGLLGLLGLPVALGRTLLPGENQPGRDGVAVLDHGFWQRQFGGDRSVLGRTVTIAGAPVEIVGVLAPGAQSASTKRMSMRRSATTTRSARRRRRDDEASSSR